MQRTLLNRFSVQTWSRWIAACMLAAGASVQAERIKDVADVGGIRSNQLIGYGLVVGLDGSGDKDTDSPYMAQSLRNMLTRLGVIIPPDVKLKPKNSAAVMLNADLPPFAKVGQKIDVTISSLGDAKSLRGGTLLMSPLKGADGQVYAVAQGNLLVSGLSAQGKDGSKVTVNHPNAGRIPNGATVERTVNTPFGKGNSLTLNLRDGDFSTAKRVTDAINKAAGEGVASPIDATTVRVSAPLDVGQRVSFMAMIQELEVTPAESAAKVIVNSRTGTVVINANVRVSPAAVSHGNMVVKVTEDAAVSQPAPFSQGQTTTTQQSNVSASEENKRMFVFNPGVSLEEVVRAVNEVGAAPSDVVAILEALKEAGALKAELLVI